MELRRGLDWRYESESQDWVRPPSAARKGKGIEDGCSGDQQMTTYRNRQRRPKNGRSNQVSQVKENEASDLAEWRV